MLCISNKTCIIVYTTISINYIVYFQKLQVPVAHRPSSGGTHIQNKIELNAQETKKKY